MTDNGMPQASMSPGLMQAQLAELRQALKLAKAKVSEGATAEDREQAMAEVARLGEQLAQMQMTPRYFT